LSAKYIIYIYIYIFFRFPESLKLV